jgi:hypothetical protein
MRSPSLSPSEPTTAPVHLVLCNFGKLGSGDSEGYARLFPPKLGISGCVDCKGRGRVFVCI